jgi:hypothetical protein
MQTIQKPFTDEGQFTGPEAWTDAEHDMLLRGVAAGDSWEQISGTITEELNDRTPKACEVEFYKVARRVRRLA